YRLQGVVTVVDAVNGQATLDAHPEAVRQAAVADRLVLTKADLAEGGTDALVGRLRALNPAAPIDGADVAPADLLGGFFGLAGKSADVAAWLGAEAVAAHHHHDHAHGHHHHDVNRHDAAIRAFTLTHDVPVPRARFEMFLDLVRSAHGPKLLRLKGLVALS
ncbi:GTP-binding protein, partial [Klebsiella pneumoniae]|uniref:GTP-binding protein n=1 Tax=Klebsiella pneumoniae TaxID=573 RepID=UPI000FF0B8E0